MDVKRIDERISVCDQISVNDVATLKAMGFRSIICNRPDGEQRGQPDYGSVEKAAAAEGLPIRNIPVVSAEITLPEKVEAMRTALAELPGPVLAYCRSGTRCTFLWALASAGKEPAESLIAKASAAGYDIGPIAGRLKAGR